MQISKKKLWATLFALTFISIFAATSSPLLGAQCREGRGSYQLGHMILGQTLKA